MPPRMKRVSANPLLLRDFYTKSALTHLTKEEVFASFQAHFHINRSDPNNLEKFPDEVFETYLSFSPPAPTPSVVPTPTAGPSTGSYLA
ncbi:hypothetical protein Q9L58_010911, partial [Maublancomyces gigas]